MIERYKILTGKYIETAPSLVGFVPQYSVTRGHSLRFCFANRIVNIWNSLPSYVVSAETVNCLKTKLDRF